MRRGVEKGANFTPFRVKHLKSPPAIIKDDSVTRMSRFLPALGDFPLESVAAVDIGLD